MNKVFELLKKSVYSNFILKFFNKQQVLLHRTLNQHINSTNKIIKSTLIKQYYRSSV